MNVTDALNIARRVTYKPGFRLTFDLDQYGYTFGGGAGIVMRTGFEAPESGQHPNTGYPRKSSAVGQYVIRVYPGMTEQRLLREIFDRLIEVETHETREFFKVNGFAPFHPHREDGDDRYAGAEIPFPEPQPYPADETAVFDDQSFRDLINSLNAYRGTRSRGM